MLCDGYAYGAISKEEYYYTAIEYPVSFRNSCMEFLRWTVLVFSYRRHKLLNSDKETPSLTM